MKRSGIWLWMEYRRAAAALPSIFRKAVILTAVALAAVGMIAFYAWKTQNSGRDAGKLRIGYVAEDNALTELAVSYVQGMKSVQNLCRLEPVTEQEGRRLLAEGELSGLAVLPADVIHEILSGSNTPAKLYLPPHGSAAEDGGFYAAAGMLFEELASAGMGMLGTAQAEIYTADSLLGELTAEGVPDTGAALQAMYDDINRFNLSVVTGREELFRVHTLSLTGNDTCAVYYGSAFLTVYGLLAGLFLGKFCKRAHLQQTMAKRRIGAGYVLQLASRCMAGGALMFLTLMLPFAALIAPPVSAVIGVELTVAGVCGLFLTVLFLTVYNMFLYEAVEKQESAVVACGLLAVFQAYMAGCLIPSVLLPEIINKAGALLPASCMKACFTALLTGEAGKLPRAAGGLTLWSAFLSALTLASMRRGEKNRPSPEETGTARRMRPPSVCMVMLRRLLHQKSIWLCMALAAVLSVVTVRAERGSRTQIKAAVYDGSGAYAALLEDYRGLVRFELCADGGQVREAVLNGEAECGYILPADLTERIIKRNANRTVAVYQDADAVAVPVVNEILFERVFRQTSLAWFEDYLARHFALAAPGADSAWLAEKTGSIFERQLGAAFRFEIERIQTGETAGMPDGRRTLYPVHTAAAVTVLLCALQGLAQVYSDIRDRRFYKRNRAAMAALTVLLPVLMGLLTAFVTAGLVKYGIFMGD